MDTGVPKVRPALEANFSFKKIGLELCVHF